MRLPVLARHAFVGLAIAALAIAEPVGVPAKLAVQVMLKALTYDRNFTGHGANPFLVLVVREAGQAPATDALLKDLVAFDEIAGRPLSFAAIDLKSGNQLKEVATQRHAAAVLAQPGLSDSGVAAIGEVAKQLPLYVMALDPDMVGRFALIGVATHAGRPQIVLDLLAARQANAAFEPALLKLARVTGEGN